MWLLAANGLSQNKRSEQSCHRCETLLAGVANHLAAVSVRWPLDRRARHAEGVLFARSGARDDVNVFCSDYFSSCPKHSLAMKCFSIGTVASSRRGRRRPTIHAWAETRDSSHGGSACADRDEESAVHGANRFRYLSTGPWWHKPRCYGRHSGQPAQ
jgi:hypothetical protein